MPRFSIRIFLPIALLIAALGISASFLLFSQGNTPEASSKSVVFIVLDGVGAKYIEHLDATPLEIDGVKIDKAEFRGISPFYETSLEQEFTETTSAHSLYYIAGDCSKKWQDIKQCVDDYGMTTICDFYRSKGYLCIMVSEAGDFKEARKEFDVVLYDAGTFSFDVELNSDAPEATAIADFLRKRIKAIRYASSGNDVNFYLMYSAFVIETDAELIKFMRKNFPSKKFFIFSNAKGADLCAHRLGIKAYIACIEGLSPVISSLASSRDSNTIVFITADHGMVFDCAECKGHHADASENPYARSIPFILLGDEAVALRSHGTAYDIMPSVFELSGFSEACGEMRYCKGTPLLVSKAS